MKNESGLIFVLTMALMLSACGGCVADEAPSPTEVPTSTAAPVSTVAPTAAPAESATPTSPEDNVSGMTVERAVSLAELCVENKDDVSAVQFYTYAISQQPDNAALYMARGECFTRIATLRQLQRYFGEDTNIDEVQPSPALLFVISTMYPEISECWCAQVDYQKAADMGSDEAKNKLEELSKDRPVLFGYWRMFDGPNSGYYDYYGYSEYGSLVKINICQDAPIDADFEASFPTELEISELEAKAASIDAGQTTDTPPQAKITCDAQGNCTQIERQDGSRTTYLNNEKGQPELITGYDAYGNISGSSKYIYNTDGTLEMIASDGFNKDSTDAFFQYDQSVTHFEYTMLSKAQYSSDSIWPTRDEINDMIDRITPEALNIFAILPGTTAPQDVPPYFERLIWTTTAEHGLVLRTAPNTEAEKLATIPLDSQIIELGKTDSATGWIFTWYQGQYGWVSAQYLKDGEVYERGWSYAH